MTQTRPRWAGELGGHPRCRALRSRGAMLAGAAVLAGWGSVLGSAPPGQAADATPMPALTVAPEIFPDPEITARVSDLIFSEANLDGSLISIGGRQFRLDANVLFAFNKADLTPEARAVLADLTARLKAVGARRIRVDGYTDSTGDDDYNRALSRRRAEAVRRALTAGLGGGVAIRAAGHGEEDPIADNATPAGSAVNRRVTITVER